MSRYRVPRDKESGLPEKYTTGNASTDKARARHFKKGEKKDSKDRSAYEPAPGDREAKTRESKYTKKYQEMFGEDMITESANAALKKKAEKSGISVGTLRKVYKRGVAAWRTGHRPGTTPQQWGMARVNSFITKGKTYHTADKDLREESEVVDLGKIREKKREEKFAKGLAKNVKERMKKQSELVDTYMNAGKFAFKVGERFSTPFTRKRNEPPYKVIGHFVDTSSKGPPKHGYYVERNGEGGKEQFKIMIHDGKKNYSKEFQTFGPLTAVKEDYEHEMARNELKTAMRAVERLMRHFQSNDTDDIEAWVQSKITKATDYLDTLADYMDSSDRTVKEAKVLSKQAKKLAIPDTTKELAIIDTTMPTADRSISGGGRGILENDESGNVIKPDWEKLHRAVQQKLGSTKVQQKLGSTKVGTKGSTITGYAPKNNPPNRKRIEGAMRAAANTNEETILKEARKALGKMATKPKSAKIKYISKLTKPPAEKKPKQTRKRSKKWDYNKEVKALKDKFENDMKTYRDPVMRAVIKKQHRTELKALKSIHRVHKGKHPDPIYKRLLSSFGIHLEEYGAGEQGTDALVQKYINDTPGQQCSKTVKTIKKVVSEAARRYDPVAGYRKGRPFRGGKRMGLRKSGKSRRVDASRPKFVAGKVKRKMNRQAQKAMKRTMTVTARGT